jgi:Putative motility protein
MLRPESKFQLQTNQTAMSVSVIIDARHQFINRPRLVWCRGDRFPMDSDLIAAAVMAQAGALQQKVATSVMKTSIDAEKSVLQLLQPAPPSTANLAPGVGGNLDISV